MPITSENLVDGAASIGRVTATIHFVITVIICSCALVLGYYFLFKKDAHTNKTIATIESTTKNTSVDASGNTHISYNSKITYKNANNIVQETTVGVPINYAKGANITIYYNPSNGDVELELVNYRMWGSIIIFFSLLILIGSYYWWRFIINNKTAAAIDGTVETANFVTGIFRS